MWYVIIGVVILWAFFRYKKKKKNSDPSMSVSIQVDNSSWEEAKEQKAESLSQLKKTFQPEPNNDAALLQAESTLHEFHENHGQSPLKIAKLVQKLELPDDIEKKEVILRKELSKYYKNRKHLKSKSIAIQIAFEHTKLLLQHPHVEWGKFTGLQKLQANWKSEEYFNSLLVLMCAFKSTFSNSSNAEKLSSDIARMFELWNSQNIARQTHSLLLEAYERAISNSDKHFMILNVIEHLERCYKFNPKYRDELIRWCHKDTEIYEGFLKEFHGDYLFTVEQRLEFVHIPSSKHEKISKINFDQVRALKNYTAPRLNSYDVLEEIYTQEADSEKLQWLKSIGLRIGYIGEEITQEKKRDIENLDLKAITHTIEVPKSGQKGKLAFLNSNGQPCSTEDAFKDDAEKKGWNVMRAEVSFWQAMFCLSFWEEIFDGMGTPIQGDDIPYDLFQGELFYLVRKQSIDLKYKNLKQHSLVDFINNQIGNADGAWTRLVFDGDQDMIAYSKTDIVQKFLKRVNSETFAEIVYRIAQNLNENRSGLPDFVIWNNDKLVMVEVKRVREQIRPSQILWLTWMAQEGIPNEIVRVSGT